MLLPFVYDTTSLQDRLIQGTLQPETGTVLARVTQSQDEKDPKTPLPGRDDLNGPGNEILWSVPSEQVPMHRGLTRVRNASCEELRGISGGQHHD